jgi:PKD repeat protein
MNFKFFSILVSLPVFLLSSCRKDSDDTAPAVSASFSASTQMAAIFQSVTFTNSSSNANYCLWSFGDGDISFDNNPTHSYSVAGTYTVKLLAVGDNVVDSTSLIVKVSGEITVYDGVGIKNISLGYTWADLQSTYSSYSFVTGYSTYDLYYIHYAYSNKLGAEFDFYTYADSLVATDQISLMWVFSPYEAVTSKGVSLGDSYSFIESVYGKPDDSSEDTENSCTYYYYDDYGLAFCVSNTSDELLCIGVYSSSKKKSSQVMRPRLFKR